MKLYKLNLNFIFLLTHIYRAKSICFKSISPYNEYNQAKGFHIPPPQGEKIIIEVF